MEPNWKQERPSIRECLDFWKSRQVFKRKDLSGSGIDRLLSEMNRIFSNGGAKFGCFSFEADDLLHWFVSRNRYDEIYFFENLLASTAFREVFPDVQPYSTPTESLKWEWSNSYVLGGDVAHGLMTGGPYEKFKGTGEEAMEIGRQFTRDLFGERFEDLQIFKHYGPWSEWFCDIAWDGTWIGVDAKEMHAWTLFQTDTD